MSELEEVRRLYAEMDSHSQRTFLQLCRSLNKACEGATEEEQAGILEFVRRMLDRVQASIESGEWARLGPKAVINRLKREEMERQGWR